MSDDKTVILQQALRLLGEHFDHVQILATWNSEGLSHCKADGIGNWYARQGMAHEFIQIDQARNTLFVTKGENDSL